ncbi:F-box only protein 25 [Acipenser ruthenus]|uniref:F-box only protein 25 n=1 Tax=Acipenser ruthenus TaxID=7906 RepID=A0A444U876_ACIRT|nr:F-box only protein 25 [Acipenser ruthenus]
MPFLGQDWRSPGWSWVKTEDGWKRFEFFNHDLEDNNTELELKELQDENKENLFTGEDCEVAAKKRKKDHFNNNAKSQFLEDQQNPRLIKDLLQDLGSTLCILIREVGKSVLVGNINIWICRLETILNWQQQLSNFQIPKQVNNGVTLDDLPLHMQNNILYKFSDGWDIVNLGQVTSTLHMLSEDWHLWKKLCQYHFAEKQCRKGDIEQHWLQQI